MGARSGKGSSFERKICKQLSLWWTDGERSDIFWRTSASGARATQRTKTGKKTFGQYGDIQAIDPIGQPLLDFFTFELKVGYNRVTVIDLLEKGPKSAEQQWEKWMAQLQVDFQNASSLYWALISKRDRREAVVFMPITAWLSLIYTENKEEDRMSIEPRMILTWKEFRVSVFSLTNFLSSVTPEMIIKVMERKGKE